MKRILSLLVMALAVAFLVSACSNGDMVTPSIEGVFDGREINHVEGVVTLDGDPFPLCEMHLIYMGEVVLEDTTDEDGFYWLGPTTEWVGETVTVKCTPPATAHQPPKTRDFLSLPLGKVVVNFSYS